MSSPAADRFRPRSPQEGRLAVAVEAGTRQLVLAWAVIARSALRGVGNGLQALRQDAATGPHRQAAPRSQLLAELEEARRLGRWHTAEDEALVREHEARLAAEQRALVLQTAGRRGTVGLLVLAWFVPLLWPVAIVGSFAAFPRTSRRLLVALLGLGAASLLALALVVGHWLRGDQPATPALPSSELRQEASGDLGRTVAERLVREADYWDPVSPADEGAGLLRKGLFRPWGGQPVMVIPRASWQALTAPERRALAEHVRFERGVEAIHVGRVGPSSRFQGNAITVEERVWP
jgi:hypothetical protein